MFQHYLYQCLITFFNIGVLLNVYLLGIRPKLFFDCSLFFNSLEILKSSKLSSPTFCSSFSSAMVSPVSDRPWTSSKLESLKFVQEYGLIISSCCFRGSFINHCLISHFLQPWSSSQCLLGWDQAQTVLLLFLVLQQSWNLPNFPHQHFHLRLYMRWLIQFLSPFL